MQFVLYLCAYIIGGKSVNFFGVQSHRTLFFWFRDAMVIRPPILFLMLLGVCVVCVCMHVCLYAQLGKHYGSNVSSLGDKESA